MKKRSFGESRWKYFWKRNGVYMVLTMSLIAIAAVLITGLNGDTAVDYDENWLSEETPVEQKLTGQPDERTTTTTTMITTTTTVVEEEAPDLYVLPLTNTVQVPFSVDAPLYSVTMKDWRVHKGVDFAGEEGQTVKAVARGTVLSIDEDPMWGYVIVIDHSVGVVSRYCGIEPLVRVGDSVDASDPIGTLDIIPCEAEQAPHLHFEMSVDDVPIDPVEAIALEVRYADAIEP